MHCRTMYSRPKAGKCPRVRLNGHFSQLLTSDGFISYYSGNVSVLHAFTEVWREDFHPNSKIQNEAVDMMNNHTQIYSSVNMSYNTLCTIPV